MHVDVIPGCCPGRSRSPRAERVRHQPRRRELDVLRVEKIAAHMIRVTLGGDLDGFTSLGFDDHVKLFFPTGRNGADGEPEIDFARLHAAPLRPEGAYARHRVRPARCRAGDTLGRAGKGRADAAHRRTARLVRDPDHVRLASAGRRRHRRAGDRAAAGGIAGRRARGGAGGSRHRRRRGAVQERRRGVGHLGASQRRRSRRHRRAGARARCR